ncbi:MAG: Ni/Fe hydrogenase subunit alpha, partial [Calditrichaeota bacterium]|nr:Ni/Fe hydrogenase subunit alpha [Calditrichota bacterium]
PEPLRRLRRLLYCGEWIQSHALHVYMLHAPDFLGYESVLHMAKDFRPLVEEALQLKKTGNALMELLGGRAIHPINVTVGGFYKIPPVSAFRALGDSLKWARDAAVRMVQVVSDFPFPQLERDYEFVALHHPDEYAILDG